MRLTRSRSCSGALHAATRRMTSTAMLPAMRAILLDAANDPWLEERRRLDIDKWDEVWDGVLHVVPQPSYPHQRFEGDLYSVLRPLAHAAKLEILNTFSIYDPTYDPDSAAKNYRTPDIVVVDPKHVAHRGIEGRAEIVIEILSPNDESYDKMPFYAQHGTQEMWIVDPVTRAIEVYVLRNKKFVAVAPERDGSVRAPRLGLVLRTVNDKLQIEWAGGSAEI